MSAGADPFQIVVICTGNRFRSPIAEQLLRLRLDGQPVEVSSAGTLDLGAVPALPEALDLAPELGIDLLQHRTRHVASRPLGDADLVVGFERKHLAAAVVDGGARRERTFTLPELAALLRAADAPAGVDPRERARALVASADDVRNRVRTDAPPAEVADPLGKTREQFRATAAAVGELVDQVASRLFGPAR